MPKNGGSQVLLKDKQILNVKMFTRKKEPCSLRRAMISNHQSSVRKCCSVFCAVVALAVELAVAPQGAYARATTQFEALPLVRSRQNHLLVRAFINGKAAWLTVDSGAPVSAIASNRRDYFRLKPTTADSNLPARVQINGGFNKVAIARELRIGGLILVDEPMVTVDLGGSSRAARLVHEQEIDGIIGADILFPTQAVLDCERQLLILNTDPSVVGSVPWRSIGADCGLFRFKSAMVTICMSMVPLTENLPS